ncbi:MAG: acetyl-CoA acetyltransferase [Acidimicrobiia bacterium]
MAQPVPLAQPVLVGVGEISQRPGADPVLSPLDLMAEAARRADADSRARRSLLRAVEVVAVPNIFSWRHPDPGAALTAHLDLPGVRRTLLSTISGSSPQFLLNELADDVAAGRLSVALVTGGEAMHSRRPGVATTGRWAEPKWKDGGPPATVVGDATTCFGSYEIAHQAAIPLTVYALFETALRAAAGRSLEEHQRRLAERWAGFSEVAATRPEAWTRQAFTPVEILPGPGNRMVTFPYTKRMCANLDVDQAAAVILCSDEAARAAGVPAEAMVHLHAGADAHDSYLVTRRWSLAESPAIAAVTGDVLAGAGVTVDDVGRFDLYSCFPSAVEVAMDALGLKGPEGGDERPLTLTGGLSFHGGPANNYVTHSVAAMVEACRADPGSLGLVTGVGWFLSKHSAGLWSTRPPASGYRRIDPATTQARIDAGPFREAAGRFTGPATAEATAVSFSRDGTPESAVVTALTADGRRALANCFDEAMLVAMTTEEWAGRPVQLTTDGTTNTVVG